MTKKQYKDKITRLESRIGEMQEQVVHCRRQAKLLDEEDSKKLLEKYHIESEELAELIYKHQQDNKKKAAESAGQAKKADSSVNDKEKEAVTETKAKPSSEAEPKSEPASKQTKRTDSTVIPQEGSVSEAAPERPARSSRQAASQKTDTDSSIYLNAKTAGTQETVSLEAGLREAKPEIKKPINPLDIFN